MARITLYIPDDLKPRMDAVGDAINWSEVARPTILNALATHEHRKGQNMDTAIARLRASKEKGAQEDQRSGEADGRRWAEHHAEYRDLKRLATAANEGKYDQWEPLDGLFDAIDPDGNLSHEERIEHLFGGPGFDARNFEPSDEYLEAFSNGAVEFFEQIEDKLDDAPNPKQGLRWTGNDEDGWLGRGKDVTFTVSDISDRGVLHVEARLIASNADFSLPVDKLAEQYGKPLTREVRGKIVPLDIRITVDEAKEACEIAYANPQED